MRIIKDDGDWKVVFNAADPVLSLSAPEGFIFYNPDKKIKKKKINFLPHNNLKWILIYDE